ncbi:MAG: hypothetical protein MUD02_11290 [Bacteroidales bacterium]|jgi:hypothetical protein|nr:hypothetical protein [Bacteroidales bacterium]
MKTSDLKKLMLDSLGNDADPRAASSKLEEATGSFDFRTGFEERVMNRLSGSGEAITREFDFVRSMNVVFYRIALTGIAAIVLLLISMALSEGSLSFNTFLGLGESYDESMVYMLTGN